jgi:Phage Mu protein F like protein
MVAARVKLPKAMSELREHEAAIIQQIYGIPPELLGRLESSNKATIDAAISIFGRITLAPRLEAVRDVVQCRIPDLAPDLPPTAKLMFESPIPEDNEFKLKVYVAGKAAFKVDEWRKLGGAEPLGGEEGEALFSGMTPSQEEAAAAAADAAANGNQDEEKPKPKPGKKPKKSAPLLLEKSAESELSIDEIVEIADSIESDSKAAIAVIALALMAFGNVTRASVQSYVKALGVHGIDSDAIERRDARNASVAMIALINATTQDRLKASIIDGIRAGDTDAEIAQRINDVFDKAIAERAPLAGVTEVTGLLGTIGQEMATHASADKTWHTQEDKLVRDAHDELNGVTVAANEKFEVNGHVALAPGGFGVASLDINCRCFLSLGGDPEKIKELAAELIAMRPEWEQRIATAVAEIFDIQRKAALSALAKRKG